MMPDVALQLETSFLVHRLEVIESWPDSQRKAATRTAILQRLERLARGYGLQPAEAGDSPVPGQPLHF